MTDTPAPQRQTVLRIPAGETASNHLPQMHEKPTGIIVPANFTGSRLSFEYAGRGTYGDEPAVWWQPQSSPGIPLAFTVEPGTRLALSKSHGQGCFFRIAAAEPQAEAADFILLFGDEAEASAEAPAELPAEDPQPA